MGLTHSCCLKYESSRSPAEKENSTSVSLKTRTASLIQRQGRRTLSSSEVQLTKRQKLLLIASFSELKDNLSQVGVLTFLRLFETHPEVQGFFGDLKDLSLDDELSHSKILRQHGLRIMNFLEKCISRMYTMDKVDTLIVELGRHHLAYGAPAKYMHLIGPQFVWAIKPQLNSKWDAETEEAWLTMFSYIATGMNRAMEKR